MEPEDTRHDFRNFKLTMPFSSESSDNLRSVQEIQISRRRRKRAIMMASTEEHQCSSASFVGRPMCSSASSSSSSSLVLFLLTSALLLLVCVSPIQSLPFDGRSLSHSGSDSGSNSHRSHMDLLIDPIHQAEFGDDDPFENTRVVKSVFDMVLRTPPPPTSSSNRCPPGTQSPFEGGPCIKKSTDPVALVDQSFLLDTLRGLAKEGVLLNGPQKTRRPGPGSNRRRTSGKPGSRTTTTTTAAPSTTMNSSEEELDGEMSQTTTFANSGNSAATGDINVNMAVEEEVVAITQEPSTSPSVETTLSTTSDGNEVTEKQLDENKNDEDVSSSPSSSDQLAVSSDTMAPESPVESTAPTVVVTSVTTTLPSTTSATEASPVKAGVDLRRTAAAAPERDQLLPSSSTTGNDELITVPATTTPTTFQEAKTNATTEQSEQQVKSGQVHNEENKEQVPTIMTVTASTPISSQIDQSGANNDAGGSSLHLSNQDHFQSKNQSDSQISLESQASHQQQDDHQRTQELGSFTSTTPLSPSSLITTTPEQPTFPNEEFVTTVDVTSQAEADNIHRRPEHESGSVVSRISITGPISSATVPTTLSFEPEPMITTVNPPMNPNGTVGAENQIVTGVIVPSADRSRHQFEEIHPQIQKINVHPQMEQVSLAESPEVKIALEQQKDEHKVEDDFMKTMTTRMMRITTGELPQIGQDQMDRDDGSTSSPAIAPSSPATDSERPQQLKENPSLSTSSTVASEKESQQPSQEDGSTIAPMLPITEEESKKVSDAIKTEGMNTTIPSEKVPRPLGPLEKTGSETAAASAVIQEQVHEQDKRAGAGDMSMTRRAEDEKHVAGVNEAKDEQGDNQPTSTGNNAVVNHLKDGDDDKGKETVTTQVEDVDLPIINANPPSSVSPVHDSHHHEHTEMPVKDNVEVVLVNTDNREEEISSESSVKMDSNEEEPTDNFSVEEGNDQPVSSEQLDSNSPLKTTLVPPPPPAVTPTNAPNVHKLHKFQPGDTLLQFQLPIVTRIPSTSTRQKHVEDNSFQTFPEFPATDTGKVRFPHSGEENGGASNTRAPFKPIFVQDFHLDYPPRHEEPPTQQWQIPQPFQTNHTPEPSNAPFQQQQQQTQAPILPEYYDTGSTEYLESELDRRHQKTRSRNRIRNSPEPASPSTTNQPSLPPELSFYPQQHQSPPSPNPLPPHHHNQPSLYFARRNPSSDLFPFGYLNFRTGHDRFHHNNLRLIW